MARGLLRIYLGAAPGVGKTYRMLEEGRRRAERGTDVVVAIVETHGRVETAKQLGDLEVIPRKVVRYRDASFEEMDLQAVLDRRPQVALVDEFAHTNVPGSANEKRWQDVDVLLDHGIDVVSTLNIQHLESLSDVVREITGTVQRETVPDAIVRRADQVELIDMAAQALRRRMAHGNIYPAEKVDAALASYFREGNLLSLRELALLWTAGRVDEALQAYRSQHSIEHPWETHERVVVSLDGGDHGEALLRRGARIAERSGGQLLAVHVARSDGLAGAASPDALAEQEKLARQLGGTYHLVVGDSVSQALIDFARSVQATQLVMGTSTRSRLQTLVGGEGVSERATRISGSIDVHIVSRADEGGRRRLLPALGPGLGAERRVLGLGIGLLLIVALTGVLDRVVEPPAVQTTYLLYLAVVLVAALVGGLVSAAVAALVGSLVVNWYFTPPLHTFDIARPENVFALVVFVAFAGALGFAVEVGTRRAAQAARSAAEAQILGRLAGGVLQGRTAPAALLQQVRETFGADRVELQRARDGGGWEQISVVGAGTRDTDGPGAESAVVEVDERRQVVVFGPPLAAADRRILAAFASQIGVALDTAELAEEAATAKTLEQADRVRSALLASVGHDLRTPLAGIKAAVSSLRQTDIAWSPQDEADLLATIEESADRLDLLVRDLLDMSRLQTGAVRPKLRAVWLDEVLAPASIDVPGEVELRREVPETLPPVLADPVLLERVLANLIGNAARYAGAAGPIVVRGEALSGRVEVRVIDRGPGVGDEDHEIMFQPFQRLGDRDESTGIGLGLAVARGFTEAIGGTLEADHTPGGGLTMLLTLPVAGGPTS